MVQLLCTFTKEQKLDSTLLEIKSSYEILFNKIFILKNINNESDLICSYNIINTKLDSNKILTNTIFVHRKKQTNTLYTINALNYLVAAINDGKTDSSFPIPWENYRNCILITNNNELKKIDTKLVNVNLI
jgi:hypothetical protein